MSLLPTIRFRMQRGADRWGPRRLLVLGFGSAVTRCAVLTRNQKQVRWERAVDLPPVDRDLAFDGSDLSGVLAKENLHSEYLSVVYGGTGIGIRLLSFPGNPGDEEALNRQVTEALGVDSQTTSVVFQVVHQSSEGKPQEFAVLAASMPRPLVTGIRGMVAGAGMTPVSLVTPGVAAANLTRAFPELLETKQTTAFLDVEASGSILLLYRATDLVLARYFRFGADLIIQTLQSGTNLDHETAAKLFLSGSFDFSASVTPVVEPWLHQVSISLDFLERRYGSVVKELFLFGEGARSDVLEKMIRDRVQCPVTQWHPLVEGGVMPPPPKSAEAVDTFTAAVSEGYRIMTAGLTNAV